MPTDQLTQTLIQNYKDQGFEILKENLNREDFYKLVNKLKKYLVTTEIRKVYDPENGYTVLTKES